MGFRVQGLEWFFGVSLIYLFSVFVCTDVFIKWVFLDFEHSFELT